MKKTILKIFLQHPGFLVICQTYIVLYATVMKTGLEALFSLFQGQPPAEMYLIHPLWWMIFNKHFQDITTNNVGYLPHPLNVLLSVTVI